MKIHDHRQMSDFRSVLEMMPDEHCLLERKVHLFGAWAWTSISGVGLGLGFRFRVLGFWGLGFRVGMRWMFCIVGFLFNRNGR